jgi:hypothetical protein
LLAFDDKKNKGHLATQGALFLHRFHSATFPGVPQDLNNCQRRASAPGMTVETDNRAGIALLECWMDGKKSAAQCFHDPCATVIGKGTGKRPPLVGCGAA